MDVSPLKKSYRESIENRSNLNACFTTVLLNLISSPGAPDVSKKAKFYPSIGNYTLYLHKYLLELCIVFESPIPQAILFKCFTVPIKGQCTSESTDVSKTSSLNGR